MRASIERNRKWWVLIGTSTGLFALMLDSTVVALALPSIQADLGASDGELQWVLNVYLLVLTVLVVSAGRLGDIRGRRQIFLIGFVIFTAGSVLAAASWSPDALIGARVVMAVGGAAMLPLSLALVTSIFPRAEQPRAIGIWTAVSSIAIAIGPVIGGALADLDWRLIFIPNIPIALIGIAIVRAAAPESRDETSSQRIDWPGLALLSVGLTATVLALIQSDSWGWTSPATLGLLVGGLVALVLFWIVEHRVSAPIIDFALFRNRPYLGATAAAFGIVAMYWTLLFFEPQYLQNILDYSAVEAGLLILPLTVPMLVISPYSGALMARLGARLTMTTGMLLGVVGLVILTRISTSSGYGLLFPGLLLVGVAFALVYAPMSSAAMAAMPKAKAGIASGALGMNRLLAGTLGLAAVGALFNTLKDDKLSSELDSKGVHLDESQRDKLDGLLAGSDSAREALPKEPASAAAAIEEIVREVFTFALGNALWILVGVVAVCAALTWWLVEPKEPTTEEPEAAMTEAHRSQHHGRFHM